MDFTQFSLNIQWNNTRLVQKKFNTGTLDDRVHVNVKSKSEVSAKRLLKGRKHFSQSVMVSVAVCKTHLVFMQPDAKINSAYYCDNVLEQGLLPGLTSFSWSYLSVSNRTLNSALHGPIWRLFVSDPPYMALMANQGALVALRVLVCCHFR